jgi:WD40 repeat protein
LIKELRRGTDTAEIFGLSFRRDGGAIAVSSDKGTVHVWDLKTSNEERRRSGGGSDSGSSSVYLYLS